ncbi:hypothetical protein [Paraflavitalea speifideaquila]|uniref:hypothetical protein n=1 Tax=Paraflavitalea speifideaquila TaxID=3076558 RepID=UPI0028E36D20|nr:hypothetical protein [Paraflavitalea speifideiaquila]
MRLIITLFFCCFFINTFAQQAIVSGPEIVGRNTEAYYEVTFPYGVSQYSTITWTVHGGTIVISSTNPTTSPIYAWVQWDDANIIGTLEIYESFNGQSGGIAVQVGTPPIIPASQQVNYGEAPHHLCVNIAASLQNLTYQWQFSTDLNSWSEINGALSQCYQPMAASVITYYRCITTINGTQYISDPASVEPKPLSAGTISLAQQPVYNSNLNITSTNADGGFCYTANYQYTWELSVEGGPWTTIGTSATYPASSPPIVGNCLVREKNCLRYAVFVFQYVGYQSKLYQY